MNKKTLKDMRELDELAAEAGGYVQYNPNFENEPGYDYRKVIKYCQEKGIDTMDMTADE